MLSLVVEDDFVCRKALSAILSAYGTCDIASDGVEALQAVKLALEGGQHYDLICLDIQMPNLNGQETLTAIRAAEQGAGILLGHGAKIVMTTALGDKDNVFTAFRGNADGYLTKPVLREQLQATMAELGLGKTD